MIYRLVYTQRAAIDIQRLDPKTKERVRKALSRYQSDPLSYADKLTDSKLGSYRFRIGDYRVVFDLEGDEIVVLRIGHRREIYRRG
ncbi:MAG: type II toxin-antitoxin system RelE/ParE family toxin [Candidatus Methylomirabilis oxygeniifera]|nr:MAG: type II toxin-antitoxin system RelE/ParE family toxin [Candidatus Methylomirabilis oxyfera]